MKSWQLVSPAQFHFVFYTHTPTSAVMVGLIYTAIWKVHTTFGWHEIRLGVGSVQGQDKGWW